MFLRFLSVVLLWSAFVSAPVHAFAQVPSQAFFVSIPDLPLMPGMVELEELTMSFDKPEGRIIESVVDVGLITIDDIMAYYKRSLPQLGWERLSEGAYVRQNEVLSLRFDFIDGQNYMRVMVRPGG